MVVGWDLHDIVRVDLTASRVVQLGLLTGEALVAQDGVLGASVEGSESVLAAPGTFAIRAELLATAFEAEFAGKQRIPGRPTP
jgi:hypothetical protein